MKDIPQKYTEILTSAGSAVLSVMSKDGTIQSTLVWPDYDGEFIKLSLTSGTPKEVSIRREGKATVLMMDPSNEDFYISLRCQLHEVTSEGAIEHLDSITQRNMNVQHWYGDVEPENSERKDRTVLVYLKPIRIFYT